MARKPSVILTPAEKKVAVTASKDAVKAAKAALAEINSKRKVLDKQYAADVKASDKAKTVAERTLTAAEADLLKLNPPKAEPSPTA